LVWRDEYFDSGLATVASRTLSPVCDGLGIAFGRPGPFLFERNVALLLFVGSRFRAWFFFQISVIS